MRKNVSRKMAALLIAAAMCVSLCEGFTANAQNIDVDMGQQSEPTEQSEQSEQLRQTQDNQSADTAGEDAANEDATQETAERDGGSLAEADARQEELLSDDVSEQGKADKKEEAEPSVSAQTLGAQEAIPSTDPNLNNPRIEKDSSMEAGQKVTWDCVWFGSYPQAEVVPSAEDYTAISKDLLRDGDIIADSSLYNKLQSASGWD